MADPPIDRGWAWMIALSCFGMYTFVVGCLKTGGLLLVEFLHKYEGTKAETVWVHAIVACLMLAIAPVGNAFAVRFTVRALVITGAGISSLGFILSRYATAVWQLYITYGVFLGLGFGLTYAPSLVILSVYFKKRRALANGIAGAGSGFGGIIMPLIARYAIDEYDLEGALLILGGMLSNMILVGALYRPLAFYGKHCHKRCPNVSKSTKKDKPLSNDDKTKDVSIHDQCKFLIDNERPMKDTSTGNDELKSKIHIESQNLAMTTNVFRARSHTVSMQTSHKPGDVFNNYNTSIFDNISASADNINALPSSSHKKTSNSFSLREEHKSPSALYLSTGDLVGTSMQVITDEKEYENTSADDNEFTNNESKKQRWKSLICCQPTNKNEKLKMFNWSLMRKFTFILLLISGFCGMAGYPIAFLLIPPHMDDLLIPKTNVVLVLGVSSCLDFIGRISMGWLADHVSVKRYVYVSCMVICGLSTVILLLSPTFAAVMTTGCIMGFFGGAYMSLLAVVLIEQLGIETLSLSLGLTVLFQSLAPITVNPLVGWIRDYTGSWYGGFIVVGFLIMFGGVIMMLEPWAKKLDEYLAARKYTSTVKEVIIT